MHIAQWVKDTIKPSYSLCFWGFFFKWVWISVYGHFCSFSNGMWPTVQWKVYAFKHENNANKDERIKILDFFSLEKARKIRLWSLDSSHDKLFFCFRIQYIHFTICSTYEFLMVQLPPSFFVYQNAVDFVIAPMEVRHTRKKIAQIIRVRKLESYIFTNVNNTFLL